MLWVNGLGVVIVVAVAAGPGDIARRVIKRIMNSLVLNRPNSVSRCPRRALTPCRNSVWAFFPGDIPKAACFMTWYDVMSNTGRPLEAAGVDGEEAWEYMRDTPHAARPYQSFSLSWHPNDF